ncbi:MAG: putative metal-binding motif-containing protein, partial [Flavobacteriales bacterium]|nr:putative metal-binding motif-containing protein [Flavobacteriales bacterium]
MRATFLFLTLCTSVLLSAQSPQAFQYQAIARDGAGEVLASQSLSVELTVHAGSAQGPVVYQETHVIVTNSLGLFTLAVGQGTVQAGEFQTVQWGASAHFLQVAIDLGGGLLDMGTTQLLSVPYALHAGGTDCATVSLLGDTLKQANGCFVIIPGVSAANGGCLDADLDGFYHIAGCGPVDCDDTDPQVNPGSTELCGNGLDDDCDGGTDDLSDVQFFISWHP